jgi:hypothetical protein
LIQENQNPLKFERKLLKEWLQLEEIRARILEAAEQKNYSLISEEIKRFLSAASGFEYQEVVWYKTVQDYEKALGVNLPTHPFALLRSREQHKKMPWEYEGRTWYYWLHIFSTNYGWTEEQIAHLDIDTAIGLLQEILITIQEEHEWQWSLTEIAYPYNQSTKKSEFHELPRPDWMKKIVPKPEKIKIRRDLLPIGNVIGEGYEGEITQP